jgi:hypothetical protein
MLQDRLTASQQFSHEFDQTQILELGPGIEQTLRVAPEGNDQ